MHIPENVLFAVAMSEEGEKNHASPVKDDALSLLVKAMEKEDTPDRASSTETDENVPDDALSRLVRETIEETVVVAKAAHSRDFSHELAALRESNNVNSNKRTVLRCVTPIRMV